MYLEWWSERSLWSGDELSILTLVSAAAAQGGNPAGPTPRRRHRGERGAALAEFAICFPVFMLLMLAIVDMGVNFGDKVETEHAAREAARAGSVAKTGGNSSCSLTPNGTLPVLTRQLFCMAKARTHMNPANVRVKIFYEGVNGKVTTNYQPATAGAASTATIVVCVQSRADSVSGMLSPILDDKVHESRSLVKTGVPSGGTYPATGEEHPFSGHDWSFCVPEDPNGTDAA